MLNAKNLINDNMTLELRDTGTRAGQIAMIKVSNPDNPAQHIYVRQDVYAKIKADAENGELGGFFQKLWQGAKKVVNEVIAIVKQASGGGGASPGGGGGFPILTNSQGQPTIMMNAPTAPPVALPPESVQPTKDNTMLYVGGAAAIGAVLLLTMKK